MLSIVSADSLAFCSFARAFMSAAIASARVSDLSWCSSLLFTTSASSRDAARLSDTNGAALKRAAASASCHATSRAREAWRQVLEREEIAIWAVGARRAGVPRADDADAIRMRDDLANLLHAFWSMVALRRVVHCVRPIARDESLDALAGCGEAAKLGELLGLLQQTLH